MKIQFDDPLFEAWTQRFLFTMPEGGCEIGEIKATAVRIPEGNRDAVFATSVKSASDTKQTSQDVCLFVRFRVQGS